MAVPFERALFCAVVALATGCSWWRFDDITENAPVVLLEKPGSMTTGFGVSLASGNVNGKGRLLVGGAEGASPAALYDLSSIDHPKVDPLGTHFCAGKKGRCFLGHSIAFLAETAVPPGHDEENPDPGPVTSCVAQGIGHAPIEDNGLLFQCLDDTIFSRDVPDYDDFYQDYIDTALSAAADQPEVVSVAGDGTQNPAIVVGAPSQPVAWFYAPGSEVPVELTPPAKPGNTFGQEVAAWTVGETRIFAVAEPGVAALHLFRVASGAPEYIGCLGGTPGFARTLTTGPVFGDETSELVVSDDVNVHVFDGAKLAALPAATTISCTLAALPEGALVTSFGCGSTEEVTDCATSNFGSSLAVGDLDGDGDGEVIVGASGMTVRGENGAGAVLVWDVESLGDAVLADAKFLASAEPSDGLGGAVAAVRAGNRDIIAAGLSRSGKVALFYCSKLLPGSKRTGRCK